MRRDVGRVAVAAVALLLASCGGDDAELPRERFVERTRERYDADPAEALCITDHVYDDYDRAAVRAIYDDGITSLTKDLWDPYFYSVITCLTADEAP